jgi:GT2 family glycosyltransferase
MPWIRVVLVNYNAGPVLAETVAALAAQTDGDFEAVIVDNDGSAARLALPDGRFHLMAAGRNLGFAAGSNLGARGASTPWLAMLNPDATPEPDWLAHLRRATARYPEAAMFGSTQLNAANPRVLDGAGDCYSVYGIAWRGGHGAPADSVREDARVFAPCGAAALYRRDVFEAAGGFAESFFCYLEDVDLGFRLNLLGEEAIQVADARVRHVGGAATPFARGLILRNSVYVAVRCLPLPHAAVALAALVLSHPRELKPLREGLSQLPALLRERSAIQAGRRLRIRDLARLLVWDPRRVKRMAIVGMKLGRPLAYARGSVSGVHQTPNRDRKGAGAGR